MLVLGVGSFATGSAAWQRIARDADRGRRRRRRQPAVPAEGRERGRRPGHRRGRGLGQRAARPGRRRARGRGGRGGGRGPGRPSVAGRRAADHPRHPASRCGAAARRAGTPPQRPCRRYAERRAGAPPGARGARALSRRDPRDVPRARGQRRGRRLVDAGPSGDALLGLAQTWREMSAALDAFGQLVADEAGPAGRARDVDVDVVREALQGLREARARLEDALTRGAAGPRLELRRGGAGHRQAAAPRARPRPAAPSAGAAGADAPRGGCRGRSRVRRAASVLAGPRSSPEAETQVLGADPRRAVSSPADGPQRCPPTPRWDGESDGRPRTPPDPGGPDRGGPPAHRRRPAGGAQPVARRHPGGVRRTAARGPDAADRVLDELLAAADGAIVGSVGPALLRVRHRWCAARRHRSRRARARLGPGGLQRGPVTGRRRRRAGGGHVAQGAARPARRRVDGVRHRRAGGQHRRSRDRTGGGAGAGRAGTSARKGLHGAPRIRVVAGEERHATVDRALRLLGLGTDCIEPVRADANGAIDVDHLEEVLVSRRPASRRSCACRRAT